MSIERFSTLHNLAPAAGRGLRTAAGQLAKESTEGVVNDVTQAEIIDRLIQDGSGYDWRNLPTSMATGLATSTVMKGAQQGLGVLRPNQQPGGETAPLPDGIRRPANADSSTPVDAAAAPFITRPSGRLTSFPLTSWQVRRWTAWA